MKIKGLFQFNFLLLLLCASCGNDVVEKQAVSPKLYFEMHYENEAWGHRETGFIVNGLGLVSKFDNPTKWNTATKSLSAQEVMQNLQQTTATNLTIDAKELASFTALIPEIKTSNYSTKISGGNDRGLFLYYAYQLNSETGNYDPILLEQDGDLKTFNKDESAIKITRWLKEIRTKIQ